jgi:hypothetical protein
LEQIDDLMSQLVRLDQVTGLEECSAQMEALTKLGLGLQGCLDLSREGTILPCEHMLTIRISQSHLI